MGEAEGVYPLWQDRDSNISNIAPQLLSYLSESYNHEVTPEEFLAYLAGLTAIQHLQSVSN
jgi:hypothetical protein